jgi:putative ABC transport system permease protein
MFRNYFTIAFRHLRKNVTISVINIAGLSIGMAVTTLIGLWIWNELSFDTYNKNYKSIAQIYRKETVKGESYIAENNNHFPIPLAEELRKGYGNYFQKVALSSGSDEHVISYNNHPFSDVGRYVEPSFTDIFTLKIRSGQADLREANSILLSSSLAHSIFGDKDATGKIIQLDNKTNVRVTGVFEDIPRNTRFSDQSFFAR